MFSLLMVNEGFKLDNLSIIPVPHLPRVRIFSEISGDTKVTAGFFLQLPGFQSISFWEGSCSGDNVMLRLSLLN